MVSTTTRLEEGGGEKATVVIWGHVTLVAILVRPARPRAHMLLLLGQLYGGGVWGVWGAGEGGGTKPLLFLLQSREATPIASKGREDAGQGRSQ